MSFSMMIMMMLGSRAFDVDTANATAVLRYYNIRDDIPIRSTAVKHSQRFQHPS